MALYIWTPNHNTGAGVVRIGVDLRSLEGGAQHRGIGRYASELLLGLSHIDHENEYVFFTSHPKVKFPELTLNSKLKHSKAAGKGQGLRGVKYIRIAYLTPRPLKVDSYGLDVFFQIDTAQPISVKKTPVVSVVYDLIPYIYKDIYQHVHLGGVTPGHLIGYTRMRLKWRVMETWLKFYKNNARVISISEHSKKDLVKFVPGIEPKRIIAIPLAAGQLPPVDTRAKKSMEKLGLKQFIFYIGGADPRKGLVDLVKSFEDVWKEHPSAELVLAGKEVVDLRVREAVKLAEAASKSSRPKQIRLLGFVSDGELAWLYKHATAFAFPSRYEGFGLPLLEAMQAGCPVITYDNSSLPEVAGNAAIVLRDGTSMAPSICRLLSNKTLRDSLIKKGTAQAKNFTWDKTARQTLDVLLAAARKDKV